MRKLELYLAPIAALVLPPDTLATAAGAVADVAAAAVPDSFYDALGRVVAGLAVLALRHVAGWVVNAWRNRNPPAAPLAAHSLSLAPR